MVARKIGDDIVQECTDDKGDLRWIFHDIQAHSFSWRAERRPTNNDDWRVEQRVSAQRAR